MMKENVNMSNNLDRKNSPRDELKLIRPQLLPEMPDYDSLLKFFPSHESKTRMNELFNDFKKININDDSNLYSSLTAASVIGLQDIGCNLQSPKKSSNALIPSSTTVTSSRSVPGSSNSNASVTDTLDLLKVENYTESKSKQNFSYSPSSSSLFGGATTLYVGDLDPSVSESKLKKLFYNYKSLLSVKLCCSPTTKESLGYGYVNFSDEVDARRVIEDLNYTNVSGKEIRIMPYIKGKNKSFMSTNVFISNLNNDNLTLRGFYDKFKHFGSVLSCKLDLAKRQGFICFKDKVTAERFVKTYNSSIVDGSKIHCSIHIPKSLRQLSSDYIDYSHYSANEVDSKNIPANVERTAPVSSLKEKNIEISSDSRLHTLTDYPKSTVIPQSVSVDNESSKSKSHVNNKHAPKAQNSSNDKFTQIYVKGLPLNVNEEEIRDLFGPYGTILEIYKESVSSFKSTWCLINFENHSSAVNAISTCHKVTYKGRKITCVKALKKAERQQETPLNEPVSSCSTQNLNSDKNAVSFEKSRAETLLDLESKNSTNLYIYNLPKAINENFFKLFLRQYKMNGVPIKYSFNKSSKANYILFEKKSDAKTIHHKLNGVILYGRVLQTSLKKLEKEEVSSLTDAKGKCATDGREKEHVSFSSITDTITTGSASISERFHPIGHHFHDSDHHFVEAPVSPPTLALNNYLIPSLGSTHPPQSHRHSINSGSTDFRGSSTSAQAPIFQNINGKPYKLITLSSSSSANGRPLDMNSAYIVSKQGNSPLSYLDFYMTGIESENNEKLYSDLEKLSLQYIDFLKFPSATRPRNLKKVLNYLVVTLWDNDIRAVQEFVNTIDKDQEFAKIFKQRLIGAIKLFGFER